MKRVTKPSLADDMQIAGKDAQLWHALGEQFHQDALLDDSVEETVERFASSLNHDDITRLKALVTRLLSTCSDSELKGHWNRSGTDWLIETKGARALIECVLDKADAR